MSREDDLKRLDQLEIRRLEIESQTREINASVEAVRQQAKAAIAPLNDELAKVTQEIDGLRLLHFPRMTIG